MNRPRLPGTGSAEHTLSRAIGVYPEVMQCTATRGPVATFHWRTPSLAQYELEPSNEVILAMQTGGGRVWTRSNDGWSDGMSVPGRLNLLPSGCSYLFKQVGTLEFVSLHVHADHLSRLTRAPGSRVAPLDFRWAFEDPFARECLRRISEELRRPTEQGPLLSEMLTDALWLHLAGPASAQRDRSPAIPAGIARARDKIESHFACGVSLDALATEAGTSRFHFVRAFSRAMGETPHRYLTRCRIRRAMELLRRDEMPLTDVALSVGFSSHSHFCAAFRGVVGRTPREFRSAPFDIAAV